MMDESVYAKLVDRTLRDVEGMFEDVGSEVVDLERSGDVVTFTFANGRRAVLNAQRPTRQLWLAANAQAWHFGWDDAKHQWLDDKAQAIELFTQLATIAQDLAGVSVETPTRRA